MSTEQDKPEFSDNIDNENFEQMLEESLNRTDNFSIGDSVSGKIVFITDENVFVDISGKSEAVIAISEFHDKKGNVTVKKGDPIEGFIVSTSGGEIHVTTSIGKGSVNPQLINLAFRNSIPVYGTITNKVKGGYSVSISGIRCFCPFSQIDLKSSPDEDQYLNTSQLFRIIEYKEKGKNIIVSRRALQQEKRAVHEQELKENLNEGDTITGTVSTVKDFGVFVDIGSGIEGLVPKSELSWSRYISPSSFETGQEITARIKSADWEKMRITLSIKDCLPEPWDAIENYSPGQTVNGTVVNIIKTGAFVEIEPGLDGFVHISRMSLVKKVNRPEDILTRGDKVNVKIIDIKTDEKKLGLELLTDEVDPWQKSEDSIIDSIHTGVIESSRSSGLRVRLSNGMLGFLPRKELDAERDIDIQKKYPSGNEITVIVLRVNTDERELILSEKGVIKKEEKDSYNSFIKKESESGSSSLGNLLKNQFDEIQKKIDK